MGLADAEIAPTLAALIYKKPNGTLHFSIDGLGRSSGSPAK
jgi:hypothetical protein